MEPVIAWIIAFMVSVAPPGRKTYYAEAEETKEVAMARYQSIAEDLIEVVYDPNTKPLFRGSNGRSRTVSVMLAIMLYESGFMRNVDYGIGKFARGDNGNSWCMMQLNIGKGRTLKWNQKHDRRVKWGDPADEIFEGHTGVEMTKDRRLCFKEGLKVLRLSFTACRGMGLPLDQRLRVYGSGNCHSAQSASALRMNTAIKWFQNSREERRKFKDIEIIEVVEAKLAKRKASEAAALAVAKKASKDDARTAEVVPEKAVKAATQSVVAAP